MTEKFKKGDRVAYRGDMTDVGTVAHRDIHGCVVNWDNDGLLYCHTKDLTAIDEPEPESVQYHLTQAAFIARKNGNDFLANVLLTMADSL